jgi:hypothetical protein
MWKVGAEHRGEVNTNLTQGWKDGSVMMCELVNARNRSGVPAGG